MEKKHGKGITYYDNGNMKFNGYFDNDLMDGYSVMLYNEDGSLEYEGSYEKGQKNGHAKIYNKQGKLVYSGELKDNVQTGKSCIQWQYYPDTAKSNYKNKHSWPLYTGELQDGNRRGFGKIHYESGKLLYQGMFKGEPYGNLLTIYGEDGSIKYVGGTKIATINEY